MVIMGLSRRYLKRGTAKYFRGFLGLPEKEVGIIFLENGAGTMSTLCSTQIVY